jgi:hypothetical protein
MSQELLDLEQNLDQMIEDKMGEGLTNEEII